VSPATVVGERHTRSLAERGSVATRRSQVRSPGTGSIIKVEGRKGWRASVVLPGGRRPSRQFTTKRDAEGWLREQLELARSGRLPAATGVTLGEWMERWLSQRVRAYATKEVDRIHWERYGAALGHIKLERLTAMELRHFFETLEERFLREKPPLGRPHTLRLTYTVLRTSLRDAVEAGLIAINPMTAVRRPRLPRPEPKFLTLEETRRLIEAVDRSGAPEAIGVHLMLRLGLRRGEALGLFWRDVDLRTGEIAILQQLQRVPNPERPGRTHLERVPLKTHGSVRKLVADGALLQILRVADESRRRLCIPGEFVVTQMSGDPFDPSNFAGWLTRLGISVDVKVSPHRLRHTAATLMLNSSVPLTSIGAVLGHTDSRTTLVYARVTEATKVQAISVLGETLEPRSL
jgi:integrase